MWIGFDTNKHHGIVEVGTGRVIAYENFPAISRRKFETHVKTSVNTFPYTDEDLIIIGARKALFGCSHVLNQVAGG